MGETCLIHTVLSGNIQCHLCACVHSHPSQHEDASVMMFEHLLESNNLKVEFERCGLGDKDIKFIKEQIAGPLESEMSSQLNSVSVQFSHSVPVLQYLYDEVALKPQFYLIVIITTTLACQSWVDLHLVLAV